MFSAGLTFYQWSTYLDNDNCYVWFHILNWDNKYVLKVL